MHDTALAGLSAHALRRQPRAARCFYSGYYSAMNVRLWVVRLLYAGLLLGTFAAVALWVSALTAQCEGFGCIGVGVILGIAFVIQLACLIAGAALIWLERSPGRVPNWLFVLEALHGAPVLWFMGRMLLS